MYDFTHFYTIVVHSIVLFTCIFASRIEQKQAKR